jgi:caffeoyl-CoA O-methyltransferase
MRDITDPELEAYATEHSSPEPALLSELAAATREFSESHQMMVGRLEGRLLKILVAAVGARRVLEVGTFTGYSALSMAEALPPDGRLITCELDERHARMARSFIARSAYANQIEVRVGPAIETLRGLAGPFDFCFIDADKTSYLDYFEAVLPLVRPGRVLDTADDSPDTQALRQFAEVVAHDERVECVIVPIRDGVSLIRKL